jgi:hypothetical protein
MLTVKLDRKFILLLTLLGSLFVCIGLILLCLVLSNQFEIDGSKIIIFILFEFFAIGCGGLIVFSQIYYLIKPPTMLSLTPTTLTFGTGLRYKPFQVSASLIKDIRVFEQQSNLSLMGKTKTVSGGIEIEFKNDASLPSSLATSAGISYMNFVLRVSKPYMQGDPQLIVDEAKTLLKI